MENSRDKQDGICTQQQYEEGAQKIADWASNEKFNSIYAIPTGALTLGQRLHNLLEIPLLLHEEDITRDTLIVDDIVHTGGRLERLFNARGTGYRVAVLFLNTKEATLRPDYFVYETEVWIRFPWETEKSSRRDGTR